METVLKAIADWIKGILTAGIMSNLSGLFDDVNTQVGNIAQQVGTKPSSFEPRVFAMIESLSRNVVLPIAGIILTFIACYELIEMITQHNNMAQFEPALIMRWIFKTAISVWLISNTFDIVMAVFDVTQKVVSDSSSIIAGNALMKNKIIGICPNCGANVVEREKGWFCENRECRFVLWKDNAYFKRLGKRLDAHVADKLLRDGRVRLKDCKSAKGKNYNATVLLSCEADGRSKFSLEFEGGC